MNTMINEFHILKPEQDLNTLFITQSEAVAEKVFKTSTVPLQIASLPITGEDTQELVEYFDGEWIDLHDYKFPCDKNGNTYTYDILSNEEFLGLLVMHPNIINKMFTIDYYQDCEEITEELEQELYKFFLEELQEG